MSDDYGEPVVVVNKYEIDVYDKTIHVTLEEIVDLLKQILERLPQKEST